MRNGLKTLLMVLFFSIGHVEACSESSVEFRYAAFIPSSKLFKEIYGNVGTSYQLETTTKVPCWECWDVWANLDWFSKHGRSVGFEDPTRVQISTLGLGIRYNYCLNYCTSFYVGVGPTVGTIWLKNKSRCLDEKVCKTTVGCLTKIGVLYYFCDRLFLDLFVDYLYQPVHFEHRVNIGGFKTGAGLGVTF